MVGKFSQKEFNKFKGNYDHEHLSEKDIGINFADKDQKMNAKSESGPEEQIVNN